MSISKPSITCACKFNENNSILSKYYLRNRIKLFMELKEMPVLEIKYENWLMRLTFLIDSITHLNELHVRFHCKSQLNSTMFLKMSASEKM